MTGEDITKIIIAIITTLPFIFILFFFIKEFRDDRLEEENYKKSYTYKIRQECGFGFYFSGRRNPIVDLLLVAKDYKLKLCSNDTEIDKNLKPLDEKFQRLYVKIKNDKAYNENLDYYNEEINKLRLECEENEIINRRDENDSTNALRQLEREKSILDNMKNFN